MNRIRKMVMPLLATLLFFMQSSVLAANLVILGKNDWLFDKFEIVDQSRAPQVKKTIDLIDKFDKLLQANGIRLILAIVPIKMRIYQGFLPEDMVISESAFTSYGQVLKALKAQGVQAVDLNEAFLTIGNKPGTTPLFFRLDSHWTPTGVLVAANTIKDYLGTDVVAKQLLESIAEVAYSLNTGARKRNSLARDLVSQLPAGSRKYDPDQVVPLSVARLAEPTADQPNTQPPADIGLVGSSYSRDWFGFADALRYVLQRDLVSLSVGADQGSWVGMESYLRSDAFKARPPKLLIWEMPERDLHATPDYRYRDAKYVTSNAEWLKRTTDLVKKATSTRKR